MTNKPKTKTKQSPASRAAALLGALNRGKKKTISPAVRAARQAWARKMTAARVAKQQAARLAAPPQGEQP